MATLTAHNILQLLVDIISLYFDVILYIGASTLALNTIFAYSPTEEARQEGRRGIAAEASSRSSA